MFNILLLPVSAVAFWEWTLLGMVLWIIKDLMEIRSQIQEEMRVEKIDSDYKNAKNRWKEERKKNG